MPVIPIANLIFGLVVMLVILGGSNYYVVRRMYQCLRFVFPQMNPVIYTVVSVFLILVMILGFARVLLPIPYGIKKLWGIISVHWMGFFVYLVVFFALVDAVLLMGSLLKAIPNPMPESIRFFSGLLVVLMAMGTAGYGIYHANQIQYVSYDVRLEKNVPESALTIVLISDLHLGAVGSEERVGKIVHGINELEPDIVCIAGDMFDNDYYAIHRADEASAALKKIHARYGVYACLGNHDGGETLDEMLKFLERSNIKLLADEYVTVDERLVLVGRLDPSPIGGFGDMERRDLAEVMAGADVSIPVVVMDHDPGNIGEYGNGTDLILAGHTHRGQVFPGNLFTRLIYGERAYGYSRKDDGPHVVVTSGAGTWGMPMRVGTDCEIVSIRLTLLQADNGSTP